MNRVLINGINPRGVPKPIFIDERDNLGISDNSSKPTDLVLLGSTRASSFHTGSNPLPVADPDLREGWLYNNDTGNPNKLRLVLFYNDNENLTLDDLTGLNLIITIDTYIDNSTSLPFFEVLTKPTGTNDADPAYHSKLLYKIADDVETGKGEKMVFTLNTAFGSYPELGRFLKHVNLTLDDINSEGEQLSTEEILSICVISNETAGANEVKFLLENAGYVFKHNRHAYIGLTTQQASGSVSVSNFPATQTVDGSVSVSNFPATQPVSGSVSVSNQISGFALESGGNLDTIAGDTTSIDNKITACDTSNISGSVSVSNFPATQPVSGSVSVSNQISGFALESGGNLDTIAGDTTSLDNKLQTFQYTHTYTTESVPGVAILGNNGDEYKNIATDNIGRIYNIPLASDGSTQRVLKCDNTGKLNVNTDVQATYNTTLPTLTDGQSSDLQCNTNGELLVNVQNQPTDFTNSDLSFTGSNLLVQDDSLNIVATSDTSTASDLQAIKVAGHNTNTNTATFLTMDTNNNLNTVINNTSDINVNVNNGSAIDVNVSNGSAISVDTGLNSPVLTSGSSQTVSSTIQGVKLFARNPNNTNHNALHVDDNNNLNVNLSDISATSNINSDIKNFSENKIGVYNTTAPTLTNSDESKIRMSENAEPIVRQRCNGVVLPESKDNWNVQVPISCSGSYIATPNIPYRYNNANSDFVLDVGHPAHLLRDFRRNNNVYSYNATFNYTNTSNNENLLFFQNSDTDTDIYLYSVSLEAQSPTNPANGEYMFVLLNVMTGLDVSGNLPQTNGTSRESTFSLQSLSQGDGSRKKSGDTTATGTDRGQLMTLFIGQGGRSVQELDLLNSLLRLGTNNGLRLRVEGNMLANINYNLTIKYIRTNNEL